MTKQLNDRPTLRADRPLRRCQASQARQVVIPYTPNERQNHNVSLSTPTAPATAHSTPATTRIAGSIHPILALKLRFYAPESIAFTAPLALAKSICPA